MTGSSETTGGLTRCAHSKSSCRNRLGLVALGEMPCEISIGIGASASLFARLPASLRKKVCFLDLDKGRESFSEFLKRHNVVVLLDVIADGVSGTIGIIDLGVFVRRNPVLKHKSPRFQNIHKLLTSFDDSSSLPKRLILLTLNLPPSPREGSESSNSQLLKNLSRMIEGFVECAENVETEDD